MGKNKFEKTSPKEFFDASMMIWALKMDLTAEIKISENVLSLFGALYAHVSLTLPTLDLS